MISNFHCAYLPREPVFNLKCPSRFIHRCRRFCECRAIFLMVLEQDLGQFVLLFSFGLSCDTQGRLLSRHWEEDLLDIVVVLQCSDKGPVQVNIFPTTHCQTSGGPQLKIEHTRLHPSLHQAHLPLRHCCLQPAWQPFSLGPWFLVSFWFWWSQSQKQPPSQLWL
jgi:hypothetical protein